jgi:hypothetical protein
MLNAVIVLDVVDDVLGNTVIPCTMSVPDASIVRRPFSYFPRVNIDVLPSNATISSDTEINAR